MTDLSAPPSVRTGEAFTVSNTASAGAAGGAAPSFSVGIYLSTDNVITSSDRLIASRFVSGLTPGASSPYGTAVTIPNNVTPGTYYIGAIADYGNAVAESDEMNNALANIVVGPTTMTATSSLRVRRPAMRSR
jgi:subtilase family serine protease